MRPEPTAHVRRQRWRGQTVVCGEPLEQCRCDEDEVVAPLSQWRQREHDGAQAEVEVIPKTPFARSLREMLVGRRQNAYVDGARFRPTDPADLFVLQHAQQLGLETEGQVADLVEEQRARVRHLEQPWLGRVRVRERASLVTE